MSGTASPLTESDTPTGATGLSKSPVAKVQHSATGSDGDSGANPDMVAVILQCSCNLGNIHDAHLQQLLTSLYEVSWGISMNFAVSIISDG
jgi:hypothetical protein